MTPTRQHLIVLGSGFASFSLLKQIDGSRFDVTVVSMRNHFLFTPLLPSTTVGTLEFRSIVEPVRGAREGLRFYQAEAIDVDVGRKVVRCRSILEQGEFELSYDLLAIGVGADVNTFGVPGVREHAVFLKEAGDARRIRQTIVDALEHSQHPGLADEERRRLRHFVVVGGGPTGVEFAAEMHDLLQSDLRKHYAAAWKEARITLLEAGPGILTSFDAALGEYTIKLFQRQRIEVRTGSPVVKVEPTGVDLKSGERIPCALVVWSTGVVARPFTRRVQLPKDRFDRIITDECLRVAGVDGVYAYGDCATIGELSLPMTAQVAQQQGAYLAKALRRRVESKDVKPFRYRHYGMLAYVGSHRALADLSNVKWKGFLTFLFWRSVYLTRLVSWKNKILVVFDWAKTLVFGRDLSRF
jgi:NADH:ubiquinone reductase (non-electrogenic)